MRMRWMMGVGMVGISVFFVTPSVWAADESTAEAAQVPTGVIEPAGVTEPTREQILQAIDATRQTDPELAAEMENQLRLFESGELDLRAEGGVPHGTTQEGDVTLGVSGGIPNAGVAPGLVGPPVDGQQGEGMPSYMTPELREQLSTVFDRRGAGELTEEEARAQAETILQEHGVDPREVGPGHEGELEHMSPEAREQMEQFFSEHEAGEQPTMDRETFEREFGTFEAPTHEYEAVTHEYEAPIHEYEAPTHEYEAPEFDQPEYEPQGYDYQPPQQP